MASGVSITFAAIFAVRGFGSMGTEPSSRLREGLKVVQFGCLILMLRDPGWGTPFSRKSSSVRPLKRFPKKSIGTARACLT
eukprot:CAMPEP_0170177826 /NCGR_PEP_ID=MMETSP0040_2-20121228/11136_1 /TAXON_ID=641309 /ORGANISM="Lotharella oceanica, Strain CCMP622" /LENGTH=80 /DNA_ID=CAMNT_0010420635 /DNA_START=503 /DNA_END=745 /DNA_ORIENTATION=+